MTPLRDAIVFVLPSFEVSIQDQVNKSDILLYTLLLYGRSCASKECGLELRQDKDNQER